MWFKTLMCEVADDRIFLKDELDRTEKESYEAACSWVRKVLIKKTEWADAFIAVRMDGEPIREYAASKKGIPADCPFTGNLSESLYFKPFSVLLLPLP